MKKLNGFNFIAPYYDRLASLIFGKSTLLSQLSYCKCIPPGAKVLILGGGSGTILKEILLKSPEAEIWYIEASSSMLAKATQSVPSVPNIKFIHGTENDLPSDQVFDVVILQFFLDLFTAGKMDELIKKVSATVHDHSIWLISDFIAEKPWQKVFSRLMYIFFYVVSNTAIFQLPDWESVLSQNGLHESSARFFYHGFIKSAVYLQRN